jgi:flagellar basal-body rod modification protein FlgD
MAVTGIDSSTSAPAASLSPGAERVVKKSLGQSDFLKLIAVQFASQDPLKPMEDTSFIAQMANFSALENSTQLAQSFAKFTQEQNFSSAQSMLGRSVTLQDPDTDTEVTGVVSSVRHDGTNTQITVNGTDYAVGTVRRVEIPKP